MMCVLFVFFFKQKTAYEMRISDWSSDVCSSDLEGAGLAGALARRCAALRTSRPLGNLDGQRGAAVLHDQLRNPCGLLADEHIQCELSGLDHVERLLPHGGGSGVDRKSTRLNSSH